MRDERKALADRAAKVFAEGNRTYSEALDIAMAEVGGDAQELFRSLLNCEPDKPVLMRHRNITSPDDLKNVRKAQ